MVLGGYGHWVWALCTGVTNWGGTSLGLGMSGGLCGRVCLYVACDSQVPDKENAYHLWSLSCAVFSGCTYIRTACKQSYREQTCYYMKYIKFDLNESGIPTPRFNYSGSYRGALTIMILI